MTIFEKITVSAKTFFFGCEENGYRARIFGGNFLIFFLFAIVAVKCAFGLFSAYFPNNIFFADVTKTALIQLTNKERESLGLAPLNESPALDRAAFFKARDMLAKEYFAHQSPDGITPWYWFKQSNYPYKYAGENLAIGFIESEEVNNAWLESPAHKANIINAKYREIGIAVLRGNFQGNVTTLVVQMFGTKNASLKGKDSSKPAATLLKTPETNVAAPFAATIEMPATRVMGASTVSSYAAPDSKAYRLVNFIATRYFDAAQALIYWSLIFIIVLLVANFALKADFQHKDLLFKAAGFIALMAMFAAIDRQMMIMLIPHAFTVG